MSTAKRAALIAGAAKGIDRAIARHLVASGWQVGIIDLADSGLRGAFAAMHSLSKAMCATRKPRPTRRRSDYSGFRPVNRVQPADRGASPIQTRSRRRDP